MAEMKGLPPGGEVWKVDGGNIYVVYFVPGTNPPIPIAWHVNRAEDLDSIYGPDVPFSTQRDVSAVEFARMGGIKVGVLGDIENTTEDPFDGLVNRYAREAKVKPFLKDPTVLASIAEAAVEGRQWDAETDLPLTDYWRTRTPGQREWDLLAASDPKAAEQRMSTGGQKVRELLAEQGISAPPGALAEELSRRWIQGEWTEQQLVDNVRRATDPYAPGATSFPELLGAGGRTAPEGRHVMFGGRNYLVSGGKHYQATGPGQVAGLERLYGPPIAVDRVEQLGAGASQTVEDFFGGPGGIEQHAGREGSDKPPGWYGMFNGRHYLVSMGKHYQATSPEGIANLQRMYGAPAGVNDVRHLGGQAGQTFEDFLATGPGRAGFANVPGVTIDPTALGGEEQVRGLLRRWLGPWYEGNFSDEWVAEWAGRLRNGAEGEEDVLVEQLRNQAKALWGTADSYEDKAAPWRGVWQRFAGSVPDESKDALFLRLLTPEMDAAGAEILLRNEGYKRGWEPVTSEFMGAAQQALGGQVLAAAE